MNVVHKYGGTSVATVDKIKAIARHVADVRKEGRGIAVVASGVTVGEGAVVSPSAMVREDVKGGERV